MQDLKDVTNNVHYENYRSRKLAAVTCNGMDNNKAKGQLTKYVQNTSVPRKNPGKSLGTSVVIRNSPESGTWQGFRERIESQQH